jgi:hypothetical protein
MVVEVQSLSLWFSDWIMIMDVLSLNETITNFFSITILRNATV